ncbi:MAG: hypothetical protein N4A48_13125 [Tepidibacter sp.]|uniref:hypothetical protein n=1 Tax=Tepidibacter sp. TaxID=2529387 RepID=UPI0025CCE50F|nr:hypothetical protein [Tepidibacter sp.]MCT4509673.1 hypothetical protein [Tepidibacter sp.]
MAYNNIDLIDKMIYIEQKRKEIYIQIANENFQNKLISIIVKTLLKNLDRNLTYYTKEKEYIEQENLSEVINFLLYDKILFLINKFKKRLAKPDITNVKSLLKFSISWENQVYALLIDIQGRVIEKEEDIGTNTYILLTKLIKEKEEYIKSLEAFAKRQG